MPFQSLAQVLNQLRKKARVKYMEIKLLFLLLRKPILDNVVHNQEQEVSLILNPTNRQTHPPTALARPAFLSCKAELVPGETEKEVCVSPESS